MDPPAVAPDAETPQARNPREGTLFLFQDGSAESLQTQTQTARTSTGVY